VGTLVDSLERVLSMHVEERQAHIAPVIVRIAFDSIPFDEVVRILVPPKPEIQRRNLGTNT
jgi:hypothetical protein